MQNFSEKEQLILNFNRCTNWEEKYLYLIEIGTKLPKNPSSLYKIENKIFGCQSQAWIRMNIQSDRKVTFEGDSDSAIVKGLISMVFIFYKELTPEDIINLDTYKSFKKLDLIKHLTPSRSHGLGSIIKKIQSYAKKYSLVE